MYVINSFCALVELSRSGKSSLLDFLYKFSKEKLEIKREKKGKGGKDGGKGDNTVDLESYSDEDKYHEH